MSGHSCHAIACKTRTKPEKFMCRRHWFYLPRNIRSAVYLHYRDGQCEDWKISNAYADTAQRAIRIVAEQEGLTVTGEEDELKLYDMLRPDNDS